MPLSSYHFILRCLSCGWFLGPNFAWLLLVKWRIKNCHFFLFLFLFHCMSEVVQKDYFLFLVLLSCILFQYFKFNTFYTTKGFSADSGTVKLWQQSTLTTHPHICMFTLMFLFSDSSQCSVHLQRKGWGCWMKSGEGSSCFLPRSYNLSSSSHRSSVQMLSVFWPFYSLYKKNDTTNSSLLHQCTEIEFFYTSGTVLEWDCHMLTPPLPCILYLYAISDGHAGHLDTGLRLRNPAIVHPVLIIRCCFISVVPLLGLAFYILYIL